MNVLKAFLITFCAMSTKPEINMTSIYDIKINSLQGQPIDLNAFKGKHILFVNVASKCGFTPQYKELQKLHEQYGDKVAIIGVPCNQFGGQEPGTSNEILEFCEVNYGVSFLITEKINNGVKVNFSFSFFKKFDLFFSLQSQRLVTSASTKD